MAKQSFKIDTKRRMKVKQKKLYNMGKKILNLRCDKNKIDISDYLEISELKAALKYEKLCKPLKEDHLHAVALYLWEVVNEDSPITQNNVTVNEDEKCPVCGMFTYKYPRWASQIFFIHDGHTDHFSFDGVKDMMKFYFNPNKWGDYGHFNKKNISSILVTDYYTQKGIDGTKAFYVIYSDILGPMGNELIPFENLNDAKVFKQDHRGTKVIGFDDINANIVYALDGDN
jgi:nitrous oxide reductase accessory protein NosL